MPRNLRSSLVLFPVILAVFAFNLSSCGGNSGTKITVPPPATQYLYVASNTLSGLIAQYTLPLTSTSMPSFSIAINGIDDLALDSAGDLICTDSINKNVLVYDAPLSASSTPSVTFSGPMAPIGIALDSSGDLLIGSNAEEGIFVYDHPLTSSTTLSTQITNSISYVDGILFDASGNLIVTNDVNNAGSDTASLAVFASPYTGAPRVLTPGVSNAWYLQGGINGSQLFVPDWDGGRVDVYNLPLTSTSVPAFSFTSLGGAAVLTFDQSGNLYVGSTQGYLWVFAPPFSAASTPTLTLTPGGSSPWQINGMTITPGS